MPEKDQPTTPATGKDTKPASSDQMSRAASSPDPSPATSTAMATPDPAQDVPNAERRTPNAKEREPACPTCAGPLERYVGANIHKLLSGWCGRCGVRHHLDAAS